MNMSGLIIFVLLAGLEIVLAVMGRGKENREKTWRKNRLFVRGAELGIVLIAVLLPFGQKWRFVPLICVLAVLLLIAAAVRVCREGLAARAAGDPLAAVFTREIVRERIRPAAWILLAAVASAVSGAMG